MIGQRPIFQEHKVFSHFYSTRRINQGIVSIYFEIKRYDLWYQTRAKSRLKKAAIEKLFVEKDLLAVLPTGYGKSLSVQLPALLAKRAGNYASYVMFLFLPNGLNIFT